MNELLTQIFIATVIAALAISVFLRFWLSWRQSCFVAARRAQTPAAFAGRISLAAHQRAADYTLAKARLGRVALGVETLLFLAFTWGGGLQALHDFWSDRLHGLLYGVALIASVAILSALVELPLDIYRQFRLESRFGFNRMTPALFFSDLAKQTLIAALLGLPLLAAVLWLMASMGDAWWLYVWLLWMGFNLLALFIYPLWIAPRFNRFTPLADGEVKERVRALLERGKFGDRALFVMDGSKRSSHGNAYFTGFGKARRIVFFDTLLEHLTPPQVEAVLAHELGHFHHRHIVKRIAAIFLLSLVFLALLGQLLPADWFFHGLGLQQGNTALALVLFSLVVPLFTFPLTPLMSALSRRHEFQADAYAARVASADELAAALVKLVDSNAATLTPDSLYSLFYDSHPPASLRIARLQANAPGHVA
ncbi:MAG: M48 family metallopeptidase [Zoogloeaceae bacterium]|jgi:STE24 endopeptidase|nr:M48 family metallopeptidase [Zoogloeaceae bacterium]